MYSTHSRIALFMSLAACTSCAYVLVAGYLRAQSVFARGIPVVQREARDVKVASLERVSTPGAREHELLMLLLPKRGLNAPSPRYPTPSPDPRRCYKAVRSTRAHNRYVSLSQPRCLLLLSSRHHHHSPPLPPLLAPGS